MGVLGTTASAATVALNFVRSRAPTATDDASASYAPGCYWTDTVAERTYICASAAAGAAVWQEVGAGTPATGTLTWAPPDYSGYEQRTITNAARSHNVTAGSGRNAVFTVAEIITAGQVSIRGWNNVVLIGGEFNPQYTSANVSSNPRALELYGNDGIVHIEGLYIHGTYLVDCVGLSMGRTPASGAPGGTLRLQNCRFQNSYADGSFHADNVQIWTTWAGAPPGYVGGCGPVQIDRFTGYTLTQSLFLNNKDSALGTPIVIKNVDMHGIAGGIGINPGHIFMKTYRKDPYGRASYATLENVWLTTTNPQANNGEVVPDSRGSYDTFSGTWQGDTYPDTTRANTKHTDATGDYYSFDNAAGDVQGLVRIGNPPTGEFVPLGVAGMNYTSPGYIPQG